jgi:hypothetical protein
MSNPLVVYMICNFESNEFLSVLETMTFSPSPFDGERFTSREEAKKARTQTRLALTDINPIALDIVRVRADVRRGSLGRPRKIV